jgi:hypothetical protein
VSRASRSIVVALANASRAQKKRKAARAFAPLKERWSSLEPDTSFAVALVRTFRSARLLVGRQRQNAR